MIRIRTKDYGLKIRDFEVFYRHRCELRKRAEEVRFFMASGERSRKDEGLERRLDLPAGGQNWVEAGELSRRVNPSP